MVGSAIATAAGARAIQAARQPVSNGTFAFDAMTDDSSGILLQLKNAPKAAIIAFGISGVHACASDPAKSHELNVNRVVAVCRAVADAGTLPVLFSTDSVFGGDAKLWAEDDKPQPINEYGRQKFAAEEAVAKLGIPYLIMRLSRVVADHAHHRDILFQWCSLIREKKPVRVATDLNFTPIAASDLGTIAMSLIDADVRGLIHVAGPTVVSAPELFEMLKAECRKAGYASEIPVDDYKVADLADTEPRTANTMLSIARLKTLLSPRFEPLEDTVRSVAAAAFSRQMSPLS
jgi:dTDP-4-dehydrorhamnose reductase